MSKGTRSASIASASRTIVRNFHIVKGRPPTPARVWLKRTGPPSSSRIASATIAGERQEEDEQNRSDADVEQPLEQHRRARDVRRVVLEHRQLGDVHELHARPELAARRRDDAQLDVLSPTEADQRRDQIVLDVGSREQDAVEAERLAARPCAT